MFILFDELCVCVVYSCVCFQNGGCGERGTHSAKGERCGGGGQLLHGEEARRRAHPLHAHHQKTEHSHREAEIECELMIRDRGHKVDIRGHFAAKFQNLSIKA